MLKIPALPLGLLLKKCAVPARQTAYIISAFMVICLLRWKCVLGANWLQYGIKQAFNLTHALLITLPHNNNIRNQINSGNRSCFGQEGYTVHACLWIGGGSVRGACSDWDDMLFGWRRRRGEMFQGNWSKHLSATKETSDPVNLIWMAARWCGFNFIQVHAG